MKRLIALFIAFAAVATLAALPASAEVRVVSTALGSDGQLVSLLSGTYGELFPGGSEAQPDVSVLALRKSSVDGPAALTLVPATLDQDRETAAELVLEPVSGTSHVFWQSWSTLIASRFRISSFDGAAWSDPIDVTPPGFAWRTSPAFAVTRDRFSHLGSDSGKQVTRTVLHVVWSEEGNDDHWSTMYAPLVLENGQYIGDHPVVALDDVTARNASEYSTQLQIAPVIRSRNNENSVVTAFLDQRSSRLVTVESKFIAGELSILGDEVDAVVRKQSFDKGVGPALAAIEAKLASFSDEIRPEILGPLGAGLEDFLRQETESQAPNVARIFDGARPQLIDLGFRITDGDIRKKVAPARPQLIDLGARGRGPADRPRPNVRHDARSTLATSFALPALDAVPEMLLSNNGSNLTLYWVEEGRVRFQESRADGTWSEVQSLGLDEHLDAEQAIGVLKRRVDQK